MSLNKKTWHYIKLSTKFKVQMNWHLFNILIGLLVFAVLSSAFGGSSSYSTNEFGKVAIHYVSSDLAFVLCLSGRSSSAGHWHVLLFVKWISALYPIDSQVICHPFYISDLRVLSAD